MKKKIFSIFLTILTIFQSTYVSAIEGIIGGDTSPNAVDNALALKILGAFQWIGYAIAVGMLVYVGIKYTFAAADEKADMKNSLVKYCIGSVLIMGASTIVGWIFGTF